MSGEPTQSTISHNHCVYQQYDVILSDFMYESSDDMRVRIGGDLIADDEDPGSENTLWSPMHPSLRENTNSDEIISSLSY